ncbi:MAG TPA: hypothetical protein PKN57_02310 [Saprospiraceae bacterium]|jgi:hypothetical protein|nr:hypothetical protein [Saprospiraceae bacterium]MCC6689596.1 hypothetical protein [Saprospiraceae bacterium]HMX83795.1 hypothetical protein [Saprospiraceae bacterium]HMX86036.1 hypothetical protein [Saprospiraceae bacterium]HMZ72945.1 hypothetical protein [Saprospiraceae bacterium]
MPFNLEYIKEKLTPWPILVKRKTSELLWASIFNNTIVGSTWLKDQAFSPGRWAVGYPALYLLYRIYNEIQPRSILEFGLGETSKLLCQYAQSFKCVYTIVEHDEKWVSFFTGRNPVDSSCIFRTDISRVPYKHGKPYVYDGLTERIKGKKFDLIVVDGPFGTSKYSRTDVLDIVKNNHLEEKFIIFMDDYQRSGEKNTISDLIQILNEKGIAFEKAVYKGEKHCLILCSPEYKFLCTL